VLNTVEKRGFYHHYGLLQILKTVSGDKISIQIGVFSDAHRHYEASIKAQKYISATEQQHNNTATQQCRNTLARHQSIKFTPRSL
jgi:hypothetical protein